MRILIGSPAAEGEVEVAFAQAVLSLVGHFLKERPAVRFAFEAPVGRSLAMARDILANRVLQDRSYSHLLFVDSDIGFQPALIGRMLDVDKPVVGIIAPQADRDLEEWRRMLVGQPVDLVAEACASGYRPTLSDLTLEAVDESDPGARAGFLRARQTGAGLLLVRRDALETMRLFCPELVEGELRPDMAARGLARPLTRFFALRRAPSGQLLDEDLSFTSRWVERCGGEVWVAPDAVVTHAAPRVVTGHYQRKLMLTGEV